MATMMEQPKAQASKETVKMAGRKVSVHYGEKQALLDVD
jgi:hypothetical protein